MRALLPPKGFFRFLGPTALALVFVLALQSLPFNAARAMTYRRFSLYKEGGVEVLCDTYTVAPGDFVLEIMRLKGQIAYREFREFMAIFRRLNPHVTELSRIYPGQTIVVPLKKAPVGTFSADAKGFVTLPFASVSGAGEPSQPPPREAARAVKVRRGDSVSSMIAGRFGPVGSEGYRKGVDRFRELNPSVTDLNFIYAGEVVFFPEGEEQAAGSDAGLDASEPAIEGPDEGEGATATVKPGDTVAKMVAPVYGKPGSAGYRKGLAEFRRANPHISDVNRIFPGDVVGIPQSKPEKGEPEKPVPSATSRPLAPKSEPPAENPESLAAKAAPAQVTATQARAEAAPLTSPVAAGKAEPQPAPSPAPPPVPSLAPALGAAEPAPPGLGKLSPALETADPAPPSLSRLSGLPEKAEKPAPAKAAAEAPRSAPVVPAPAPAAKPDAPPRAAAKAPAETLPPSRPSPPPMPSLAPALGAAEPAPPVLGKLAPALGSADSAPPELSRLSPALGTAEPAPPSLSRLSGMPEKAATPISAKAAVEAPKPAPVASAPAVKASPPPKAEPREKASPLPPSRSAPPPVPSLAPAFGAAEPAPPVLGKLSPALGYADPAPPSLSRLSGLPEEAERPSPVPGATQAQKPASAVSGQSAVVKPASVPKAAPRAVIPPQATREPVAVQARPSQAPVQPTPGGGAGSAKKPVQPPPAVKPPEPVKPPPAPPKPAPAKKPELVAGQGKARHPELAGLLKPLGVTFLDSGEYRFPGPGDAEFRLDLGRNPVAELPGGKRLVLCRDEALSASERTAVLSHWRNAGIVTLGGNATAKAIFGAVLEGAEIDSLKETVFSEGGATVTVRGDFVIPLGRGAGFEVITWLSLPSARTRPAFVKYLESRKYHVRETGVPAVRSGDSRGGRSGAPVVFSEGERRELAARLLTAAGVRYAKDVPVSFSYAGFDVTINADMAKCADGKEYILDYGSIYGDTEKELARMGLSVISLGKQGSLDSMMEALWRNLALEYRRNPVFSAADRSREPVSTLAVSGHFAVLPGGASVLVTRFDPSKALDEFLKDKGVTVFVVTSSGL